MTGAEATGGDGVGRPNPAEAASPPDALPGYVTSRPATRNRNRTRKEESKRRPLMITFTVESKKDVDAAIKRFQQGRAQQKQELILMPPERYDEVTQQRIDILEYIIEHTGCFAEDIVENLGYGLTFVDLTIDSLTARGYLTPTRGIKPSNQAVLLKENLVEFLEEGYTYKELEEAFDIPIDTIRQTAKRKKLTEKKERISDQKRTDILTDLSLGGGQQLTINDIARRHGVSVASVYRIKREAQLPRRRPGGPRKSQASPSRTSNPQARTAEVTLNHMQQTVGELIKRYLTKDLPTLLSTSSDRPEDFMPGRLTTRAKAMKDIQALGDEGQRILIRRLLVGIARTDSNIGAQVLDGAVVLLGIAANDIEIDKEEFRDMLSRIIKTHHDALDPKKIEALISAAGYFGIRGASVIKMVRDYVIDHKILGGEPTRQIAETMGISKTIVGERREELIRQGLLAIKPDGEKKPKS